MERAKGRERKKEVDLDEDCFWREGNGGRGGRFGGVHCGLVVVNLNKT